MDKIYQYYLNETNHLSEQINTKTKIYLDTKYWIDICDITLDKKQDERILEIYSLLKDGIQNNKIICPISLSIYLEVLSQKDINSLTQTANIIDELSQGYIIKDHTTLIELELFKFFSQTLDIPINMQNNTWDYMINILGFQIMNQEFNIQKAYFNEVIKTKKLFI